SDDAQEETLRQLQEALDDAESGASDAIAERNAEQAKNAQQAEEIKSVRARVTDLGDDRGAYLDVELDCKDTQPTRDDNCGVCWTRGPHRRVGDAWECVKCNPVEDTQGEVGR